MQWPADCYILVTKGPSEPSGKCEVISEAGASSGVPDDILGAYEELRWMEPHTSSPSPC